MIRQQTRLFLTGGLGNQLFQYAAALSRRKENIQIDCSLGNPRLNGSGQPDLFDFRLSPGVTQYESRLPKYLFSKTAGYMLRQGMQPTQIEKNMIFKTLIRILGTVSLSIWSHGPIKILQATDNGYWKMPSIFSKEYLIGYFQSYVWAQELDVEEQLRSLRLNKSSPELTFFLESEKKYKVTAVHIRLGDYKHEIGFGIPSKEYYAEALNRIEESEGIERVWLFSNEPDEALSFIPSKFRQNTMIVPHFMGSAAETLEAMRHAESYVLANSSLSWWGAFLSYSDSPCVIAPKPWFKFSQEPKKIVPSKWTRLSAWPTQS